MFDHTWNIVYKFGSPYLVRDIDALEKVETCNKMSTWTSHLPYESRLETKLFKNDQVHLLDKPFSSRIVNNFIFGTPYLSLLFWHLQLQLSSNI